MITTALKFQNPHKQKQQNEAWLRFVSLAPGLGLEVILVFQAPVTPERQPNASDTGKVGLHSVLDFWELLTLAILFEDGAL